MMFIDADEFVIPVRDASLPAFVRTLPDDWSAIGVHWAVYGSSGHDARPPGLVPETYLRRGAERFSANRHVKTLVRTPAAPDARFRNPHWLAPGDYRDATGAPTVWLPGRGQGGKTARVTGAEVLRINHYHCKSREDYARKMARGRAATTAPRLDAFAHHDRNEEWDDIVPRAFGHVLDAIRSADRATR